MPPQRRFLQAAAAFALCLPACLAGSPAPGQAGPGDLYSGLPFAMPRVNLPRIPERTRNIAEFGAKGDGHTVNTEAIAKTIEACAAAGGGTVLVTRGFWLTGPVRLMSHINLRLERGAVLQFTTRFEDYPVVRTDFAGSGGVRCTSPISARGQENIAITGEGIIDGAGQAWRPVKKSKMTDSQWKGLIRSGGALEKSGATWWPSAEAMQGAELIEKLERGGTSVPLEHFAAAREFLRPVMVSLVECRRVLLDGPTFQNSPAWNIHPLLCEDLTIRNITVLNPWYSQNGDGLDLDSCRRATVYNCRFDVGDDAICIKSGKDAYGRKRGRPCEEILISDCVVYHGHGGFTIGSEMSGGVRNIAVRRCTFLGTDVGLRFKTTRGRGGVVEKIWISDIQMKDIPTDAVGFNMYYGGDAPEPDSKGEAQSRAAAPVNEGTPQFRDITLKNIICNGAERAVMIEGLPEMPIRGISLENIQISARRGLACIDAEQITLKNLRVMPKAGPVFMLRDSRDILIEGAGCPDGTDVFLQAEGEKTDRVRITTSDLTKARRPVLLGKAVKPAAVARP